MIFLFIFFLHQCAFSLWFDQHITQSVKRKRRQFMKSHVLTLLAFTTDHCTSFQRAVAIISFYHRTISLSSLYFSLTFLSLLKVLWSFRLLRWLIATFDRFRLLDIILIAVLSFVDLLFKISRGHQHRFYRGGHYINSCNYKKKNI